MLDTCYNYGKIRCSSSTKKIQEEHPNIPKLLKEYDKSFHWKCFLCSYTTKEKFSSTKHINKIHIKTQNKTSNNKTIIEAQRHTTNLKVKPKEMDEEMLDIYYWEEDRNRKIEIELLK